MLIFFAFIFSNNIKPCSYIFKALLSFKMSTNDVREIVSSCLEKYDRACHYLNEDSKRDPETAPYLSQYAAKMLFQAIRSDLSNLFDSQNSANEPPEGDLLTNLRLATATANYNLGVIAVDTEELSTGEEHLTKCLRDLEIDEEDGGEDKDESVLTRDRILTAVQALNQLGVLASVRGNWESSEKFLKRAERLCKSYRRKVGLAPLSLRDLLSRLAGGDDSADSAGEQCEANWQLLEKALTHTFYFLAQVHNGLGKTASAAAYCHTTLRRQLESHEFEPVEWAVNAATLSQHFVMHNDFRTARHHLACAVHVLDQHSERLASSEFREKEEREGEEGTGGSSVEDLTEILKSRRADVARCWAKYGLLLLSVSWDEKIRGGGVEGVADGVGGVDLNAGLEAAGGAAGASSVKNDSDEGDEGRDDTELCSKRDMHFDLPEASVIEEQVTCKRVSEFDGARPVFLNAQQWLNRARDYYTLEEHASDHVEIVQDASKLYKVLSYFEPCADRRCKMHKRRVDLLEGVLGQINPTFYLNACRQMQFELGEIYSEMMDLKFTFHRGAPPTGSAAKKLNHLSEQSMKYYQMFIDTFIDVQGKVPEEFPEELVRPALLAHFCIGRLHSKLVTPDVRMQIGNLKASLERYDFVRQYCERYPSAVEVFREEWEVSREMSRLLPVKMEKLLQLQSRNAVAANRSV